MRLCSLVYALSLHEEYSILYTLETGEELNCSRKEKKVLRLELSTLDKKRVYVSIGDVLYFEESLPLGASALPFPSYLVSRLARVCST